MNSCDIFLKRFKDALTTTNYEALTNIFENDAKKQLQVVSTEHLEFLVDGILGTNGLLCFLNSALENYVSNKPFHDACKKGFQFLGLLIENFHQVTCFKKYINQIKNICYLALRIKCNFYIQKDACHAFIKLIEWFSNQNLKLNETLNEFVIKIFPVNTKTERKYIYCVLGKIIKHNESIDLSPLYVNAIFKRLRADALEEFASNDLTRSLASSNSSHLYLDAVSDMLDNAEPPSEIKDRFFQESYGWIKSISLDKRQYVLLKSAIELLSRHIGCFEGFVYIDHELWHKDLQRLSREGATSNYGQLALKKFYSIIGKILERQSREESKVVLQYFLDKFNEAFANVNLDSITLRLTVFGYSQMAAAFKKHRPEYDIRKMYSTITNCALPLCFSEQSDSTNVQDVCCCQEALSKIMCDMSDITNEKINVLVKLSIYTIKRFPDLNISKNIIAISSLIRIICNLASIDRSLLQQYLDDIIYNGIAWSCSHTLALDAELQRELESSQQPPICYKDYLPLWTQLLNIEKYPRFYTVQLVAETLVNVCMRTIDRLDIRVKQQYQDTVLSDVALTQSAINQADFRVFTNLIDLYVDLMDTSDASLYTNTISDFLRETVRLSYKYPLISGFYKLVRVALKIFDCTTEEEEESEIKNLISSYLTNTLELLPTFSNELLIACLYLILDKAGISYVAAVVPSSRLVPPFKIAFTMGLSDLELAYNALAALKMWIDSQQSREDEHIDELLREIVPHLESYLRNTESTVEISQELTIMKKARLKRIGLIDTECTLRNFQRRILLFLGSLDCDVLSNFLHERSLNTGASWDQKNLLSYLLHLPDTRLTLHFDRILPRVITLARDSSDRRTRIAACEVLQSMVTLMIGTMKKNLANLELFVTLNTPLFPALLALGCDSDETVRDIFQPFTLQLMHWLSSPHLSGSPLLPLVLNSFFDSLCDDANPSLREFAGLCLAEFTSWSIRQVLREHDTQLNVHEIIRKINYFALHPSVRKRVAAAVAFNHLYVTLRENDDIVSTYWLEMFYCFVRSMDGCEDPSITNALGHIEKVMRDKANVLNVAARDRKKPDDFDDVTLTHALYWLLSQCGVLDENCRAMCKELYVKISQYAVGGSARETIRTFVEIYGMDRLNSIILRDLKPNTEDISVTNMKKLLKASITNMKNLLKALDYYMWLIDSQLLSVESLFPMCSGVQEHVIFACIRNFSRQFLRTLTTTRTKFRELEELQTTLQCKAVMATLKFVQVLLNVNDVINVIPESLWNESLFTLTIKCVMHPRAIGFDVKNIKITDELSHVLETLLKTICLRCNDTLVNSFKKCLMSFVRPYVPQLLNLRNIAQSDSCDKQIQHINGLIIFDRCNLFDRSIPETSAFANRAGTIEQIFNFLVTEQMEELTCRDLSAQMFKYLRALMKLQLLQHETSTIQTLMRLISNDTLIVDTDFTKIAHGEYFLKNFDNVIFTYVLTNVDCITFILNHLSRNNPAFLLKFTENTLLHLKRHKPALREHVNDIIDAILRQFACLESAVAGNNVGTERLISIYDTAVRLMSSPIEIKRNSSYSKLYIWIEKQLIENNDIEYKTQILRNFLICLTDATDRVEDKRNLSYLYTLKNDRLSQFPELLEMTVSPIKVVNCFETLLVLLSVTGSVIVLDCLMNFAAGAGKSLFKDKLKDHLRKYYCRKTPNTTEHVLCSLERTYQRFITNVNVKERLDILHEFLLPAFEWCDSLTIERFFECNIHELYTISKRSIDHVVNNESIQFDIVSKIGCYQLMAIMITRVEENKIVDANGAIVRNAELVNVKTGRELLQCLYEHAKHVRALKNRPECRENMRLLQCSAYNFILAVVSLKEKTDDYTRIFGENHSDNLSRRRLIWRNIIDCHKYYQLRQEGFPKYPKNREVTVNIRSSIDGRREETADSQRRYSHIHSYDLLSSSLSEDVNAYDLNKCVLLSSSQSQQNMTMNVILEHDDFNEHECMPHICGILKRLSSLQGQTSEQPEWLQHFVRGMRKNNVRNIQLFMLKIINNMRDDVFKPYAKFILPEIAQVVADYLKTDSLNYIITDILETLLDWKDNVTDESIHSIDRQKIQDLLKALVDKLLVKQTDQIKHKGIYYYNLELIHRIVKKFRGCLMEPIVYLIRKMESAQEATVDLIVRFLRDNDEMAREIVDNNFTEDIINLLLKQLRDWKATDKDVLQYCECLGWYLKLQQEYMRNEHAEIVQKEDKIRDVKQKIFDILRSPPRLPTQQLVYMEKQLTRISVLCRTYPDLAVDYITVVIDNTCANKNLSYCLEIFVMAIPRLCDAENSNMNNLVNNLRYIKLENILKNREPFCESKALRIVHELVNTTISPKDLLSYVEEAIPYLENNSTEHRGLVYDILISVYKKYSADSDDKSVTNLQWESMRHLLTALLDPSEELQTRVLRFWAEETDLGTDKSKERLIAMLSLRTKTNFREKRMNLKEEDAYALFVPLLILQLASRSREYTKKIFDGLENCTYEEYKISASWRRRNLSYITPMFVDSLASQMNCTLSQSIDNDRGTYDLIPSYRHPFVLKLRATQDLQFEPTVIDNEAANMNMTATYDNSLFDDVFDRATISSRQSQPTAHSERFPRFLAKSSNVGEEMRQQNIQKNAERQEMIKQENIKQRNSVKLHRPYKIGDLPDIAIPHSSLIEPLQQLIKLDGLIRKDITVFLFCSFITEITEMEESGTFRQSVVKYLKQILHESEKDSAFNAVILETLLKLKVTDCDTCDIVRVSKTNGLNAVGVLLLECSLQPDASHSDNFLPTPEKRMKRNEDDVETNKLIKINKWAQLASLYKSLDDIDAVLSIFREQSYDENMQEAAIASADSNWERAKMAFEKAYESTKIVPSMHEYCMEGLLETVNNLCDWSTVTKLVIQTNGNLGNVWNSSWRDWMIPYLYDAYVQMLVDDRIDVDTIEDEVRVILSWIDDSTQLGLMKPLVGEDLTVFMLNSSPRRASELLNDLLDKTGEQWVKLNPLCTELGIRKLRKLQIMSDLDATLKVLQCTDNVDYLDRITTLLDFWTAKAPSSRDNLLQWNKLAAYRTYSSNLFDNRLDKIQEDNYIEQIREIKTRMCQVNNRMRLGIIDAALKQRHQYVTQNHSDYLKNVSADLQPRKRLLEAKIKYLCANLETDALKKMCGYASSWEYSHQLLNQVCRPDNESDVDVDTSIAVREHIGALASTIERLSRNDNAFAEALLMGRHNIMIRRNIYAEQSDNLASVRERLLQYSLNELKSCSDEAAKVTKIVSRKIGEHYYTLTRHFYNRLTDSQTISKAERGDIFQNFILATLRAMYHDYHEATHYFPCLLDPKLLLHGTTQRTFEGECVSPLNNQPWLFLRWRDLLFSHLGTPITFMIAPIIEKLAKMYPDAIAYTYLLAVEKNPAILYDHTTQKIRELLQNKVTEIEQFLSAIQYVVQPELFLKYHLNEAMNCLSKGDTSAFESLLKKIYKPISTAADEKNPRPGSAYNAIAKYENVIKQLNPTDYEATRINVQHIKGSLDRALENKKISVSRADKKRLKEYSPFLHAYAGGDIEIPGQYSGNRKPMPHYHAKIVRIEPIVEVMTSLRKPIRISMIGENGREYKFLVKFGEDLTIDHGLQQLYATMNRTLSNDTACRQRRLMIDTYEVIPLSRSFGLIQWIEDTKSLQELVSFTQSMSEKKRYEFTQNYTKWIADAAPFSKLSDQYKIATVKYKQAEVVAKMTDLIGKTEKNALRDAFTMISPSSESFVTLRRNFVASYATMCAAHWISGVGDRHLQNTLIIVGSGRCLGIDFGHAFGSGIRCPIPELVPFRLTPQILQLFQPFTEKHLFSTIMTHVMRALRDDKGPILACMDIFVDKPVSHSSIYDEDIDTNNTDSTWSLKKNIMTVKKKLDGIHPSLITVEQLKEAHNDEYLMRYQAIITGNDELTRAARAAVRNDCLTPTEQVNCLLDQATDLNVLGRMYGKWQPWL